VQLSRIFIQVRLRPGVQARARATSARGLEIDRTFKLVKPLAEARMIVAETQGVWGLTARNAGRTSACLTPR
jgi:hypothetical protein